MLRLVVVTFLSGCALPLAIPPLRTDVGFMQQSDGASGVHVAVGAQLGSLLPAKDSPLELGLGFVVDKLTAADGVMGENSKGFYMDTGWTVKRMSFARLLVGGRVEHHSTGPYEFATKLRVDLEILGHVESKFSSSQSDGGMAGGVYGNGGLGIYAEAGPSWGDDAKAWTATIGGSVRLPACGVIFGGVPHGSSGGGGHSYSLSGTGSSGVGASR